MALSNYALALWIEYAIAIPWMIFRFAIRFHTLGFRQFDLTDFFCALSTLFYTNGAVFNYLLQTPTLPSNIPFNAETAMLIPDDQVPRYVTGSKIAVYQWTMYITMLFIFKAVPLCIFRKLSTGLRIQRKIVNSVTVFTFLCWIASILTHLLSCRPFHRNWQIKPYPGSECTIRMPNYWIVSPLNMLTDFLIVCLPMPVLFTMHLPFQRKLALGLLFGSGSFIIACSLIRLVYVMGSNADMEVALQWTNIECFVAMIVIATPGIWPFAQKLLVRVRGRDTGRQDYSKTIGSGGGRPARRTELDATVNNDHLEMFNKTPNGRTSDVDSEAQFISRSKDDQGSAITMTECAPYPEEILDGDRVVVMKAQSPLGRVGDFQNAKQPGWI